MPAPQATRRTAAGLALVALSTLMYEVLLTRIFSVTMWYHFAFVAISVAMFGMTVGALVVYLAPRWFPPAGVKRQLAVFGLTYPLAMVASFLTQLSIPFRVHPSIVAVWAIVFTYAVVAVPFVVSGILVTLTLTRFPRDVGRLYAFDLIGAAAGCVLLVWVLAITDGPTAVLVIAAIAAFGGWAFATDGAPPRLVGWTAAVSVLLTLAAAGHTVLVWREFPILRILYVKAGFEARPLYEKWNSYSRIRVHGNPDVPEEPYTWGLSPVFPEGHRVRQLHLDIDVAAGTVLTKAPTGPEDLAHLEYDVTNIGYYLRPSGHALIVGVGGGRDILSALHFGATKVTGVEINKNIIDTLNGRFGDFTGHLDRDPRVTFVNDEARSYIARQREPVDFIQISLIDTWAATAAGAFVLSENSLYTVEAWESFLNHLTDTGLLSVSRWYFRDRPGEVYRMTALAAAALQRLGIADPRAHLAIVRSTRPGGDDAPDGVGTLLVSRTPLPAADLATLAREAERLQFEVVLSPTVAADETFTRLASGRDLDAFTAAYPINIAPPTDDSPFFFNMLRLGDVLNLDLLRHGKSTHNMEAVFVLGTLLFTVLLLTASCIVLPLVVTTDRRALDGAAPLVLFFAAIGFAFMLIETSQMQRLIVVLGHPTYGLTVVLFSLLLASGIGSWLTTRGDTRPPGRAGLVRLGALVATLFVFGLVTPPVAHAIAGASTPVRIAVSALLLFVPGVLMGMAFPLGMRLAHRQSQALTPWLWGVNGATSVCASVLAVAIALSTTISTAFWTGWLCYVAACGAYFWQLRRAPAAEEDSLEAPAVAVEA